MDASKMIKIVTGAVVVALFVAWVLTGTWRYLGAMVAAFTLGAVIDGFLTAGRQG